MKTLLLRLDTLRMRLYARVLRWQINQAEAELAKHRGSLGPEGLHVLL